MYDLLNVKLGKKYLMIKVLFIFDCIKVIGCIIDNKN